MLVRLPHGMCVNPDTIKLIHVRPDRRKVGGKPVMVYSVVIKTDDDAFLAIASYAEREQAEELANTCARRVNQGLGEDDPNNPEPEADAAAPPKQQASAADLLDDDDW